jgi:hypothetical protein
LLAHKKGIEKTVVRKVALVAVLTVATYMVATETFSEGFSARSFLGLRLAGNVYTNFEIQAIGAHIIFTSAALTVLAICTRMIRVPYLSAVQKGRFILGLVSALWFLVALSKWLLQPRPQSLPHTFAPFAILVLFLLGLYSEGGFQRKPKGTFWHFPLSFILCLPVGAIWQIPNPVDEFRRIASDNSGSTSWSSTLGRPSDGYSENALATYDNFLVIVREESKRLSANSDSDFGYFGPWGNTVELVTNVNNLVGIPSTESLRFGLSQVELACKPVSLYSPRLIVVYGTRFPCDGYAMSFKYPNTQFYLYVRDPGERFRNMDNSR